MQRGNGEYIPHVLLHKGQSKGQLSSGLKIEFVQYLPSMHTYMEAADLIISHAGSGSLFEALSLNKPIIAVPNAILMANHQVTSSLAPHPLLLRPTPQSFSDANFVVVFFGCSLQGPVQSSPRVGSIPAGCCNMRKMHGLVHK